MTTGRRTEVELAAQILARLIRQDIIPLGMRHQAQQALGLQNAEVAAALEPGEIWLPPRRVDMPAQQQPSSAPARPDPTNPRRARRRPTDAHGRLRCSACRQWLPPEQFALRTDRPGHRKSRCRGCCAAYQAARYLSVEKLDALGVARITFRVDEDSDLVGVVCADCGHPIAADDIVSVSGGARHGACPTEREATP